MFTFAPLAKGCGKQRAHRESSCIYLYVCASPPTPASPPPLWGGRRHQGVSPFYLKVEICQPKAGLLQLKLEMQATISNITGWMLVLNIPCEMQIQIGRCQMTKLCQGTAAALSLSNDLSKSLMTQLQRRPNRRLGTGWVNVGSTLGQPGWQRQSNAAEGNRPFFQICNMLMVRPARP